VNGCVGNTDYAWYRFLGVDADLRVLVSDRLRREWDNGKTYYAMRGQRLLLPSRVDERPDHSLLEWHREHVFAT
jgi:putative restriction endonuclease